MKPASFRLAAVALLLFPFGALAQEEAKPQPKPVPLKIGDTLTGQLNAMRSRVKGKRVATYQLVSAPRRLPAPHDLCNLETGPETFQLVTHGDAEVAQLKKAVGKEISVRVQDIACAEAAGQFSEAVVSRWTFVK